MTRSGAGGGAGGGGDEGTPGDYPGPNDVDGVKDRYLWSRLGGGAMAETGLAASRNVKAEQAGKAALAAAKDPLAGQGAPQRDTSDIEDASSDEEDGFPRRDKEEEKEVSRGSWAPAVDARVGGSLRSGSPASPPLKPVVRTGASGGGRRHSKGNGVVKPRTPGSKKPAPARLSPLKKRM